LTLVLVLGGQDPQSGVTISNEPIESMSIGGPPPNHTPPADSTEAWNWTKNRSTKDPHAQAVEITIGDLTTGDGSTSD
jgi:hypothetical protein